MPDRVLRSGLFTSEAWLGLKNNDERVCWIVLFGNADVFGNQPAGPHRLVHIWRHVGIDTPEKVAKVLAELADVDLIRLYEVDGKRYVHIPRYRQRLRYLGKVHPLCQWNTDEEKQRVEKKPPEHRRRPPEDRRSIAGDLQAEVDVEVDVEVEEVLKPKPRNIHANPPKEKAPQPQTLTQALNPVLEKLSGQATPRPQARTREEQLEFVRKNVGEK